MSKIKDKKKVFKSMREFEKHFFPKSLAKKNAEKPTDAKALGITLAKESLEKIKSQIAQVRI